MAILNKEQILQAKDCVTETVSVPEWGGDVLVRTLTGQERDEYEFALLGMGKKNFTNARARLAALTIVDEKGNRLFTDKDIHALGKKSGKSLQRIFNVAQRLNNVTDEDIEELEKNLESDPCSDSVSA